MMSEFYTMHILKISRFNEQADMKITEHTEHKRSILAIYLHINRYVIR